MLYGVLLRFRLICAAFNKKSAAQNKIPNGAFCYTHPVSATRNVLALKIISWGTFKSGTKSPFFGVFLCNYVADNVDSHQPFSRFHGGSVLKGINLLTGQLIYHVFRSAYANKNIAKIEESRRRQERNHFSLDCL